ncbi:hypothetical protein [Alysiella filiformis]|uniref:Uncharacterized protein n=2 Tax=Alysiella TaxID=194195 RepID=A0A286E1Q8_9NEIS|nr:hypothetical protein [Alysiella filiformis]QMT30779.1 hypothetical protein H3L97_08510 [Alysiella filiformis]SOD64825.1 hypothetical protein SAMN02746062_00053 [Alysiella filiformis DSM 16848]
MVFIFCIILMYFGIFAYKTATHRLISMNKLLLPILLLYLASLFLPSAALGNSEPKIGMEFVSSGLLFFFLLPYSLPFYANIFLFITCSALHSGRTVRFYFSEITIILILSSLMFLEIFSWGYLAWLFSGCFAWANYHVVQKEKNPSLFIKTSLFCVLLTLSAWQLGEYQRRQPEMQKADYFQHQSAVFVSPLFFKF